MSDASVLLEFLNRRAAQVADPSELDPEDLIQEAISQAEILVPELLQSLRRGAAERVVQRHNWAGAVRRGVAEDWVETLKSFDELLATSEEVHQRLLINMKSAFREKCADPDPVDEGPWLAGSGLKVVMLLSTHARACRVAAEVAQLAYSGFADGAIARLRTLYEVMVIHAVLAVGSYEVCERYHAYGAVENLHHVRAHLVHASAIGSSINYDEQIAEAEREVQEVCELYGSEIQRPYEWARPMFPGKVGRLTFADLDTSVTDNQLRLIYRRGNHGVHAGAFMVLRSIDLEKSYFNPTRPSARIEDFNLLMSGAATLVGVISSVTARQVAAEYRMLDESFAVAVVDQAKKRVHEAIQRDALRQNVGFAAPPFSGGSIDLVNPNLPKQRE